MDQIAYSRRSFLKDTALLTGSVVFLNACGSGELKTGNDRGGNISAEQVRKEGEEKEVTASEDLMREHGVLRRALIVYSEAAVRLRRNPADVPPDSLERTAKLFRSFGEDYHEKQLEEAFIFPVLKQKGGAVASYPDILIAQHTRGREITDYVLSVANSAKLGSNAAALADAFEGFVRMYETHAAREDTIIFPAWKDAISGDQYYELTEKFEEIEHQQFGEDGFDDAVRQITEIENSLQLSDISLFTAPAPPAAK